MDIDKTYKSKTGQCLIHFESIAYNSVRIILDYDSNRRKYFCFFKKCYFSVLEKVKFNLNVAERKIKNFVIMHDKRFSCFTITYKNRYIAKLRGSGPLIYPESSDHLPREQHQPPPTQF